MSKGKYILTDDHKVVLEPDLIKWAQWYETHELHVGFQEVGNGTVSTIFTGLDFRLFGTGDPLVFETIYLDAEMSAEEVMRCSTWDQAEANHNLMVEKHSV